MSDQIKIPTFAYPYQRDKSSGTESKTTQALYMEALSQDAGSQYLFNKTGLWHGGIHLKEGRFAGFDTKHIRAIADGELVYYRMDKTFLENSLNEPNWGDYTVQYASGFFLLKHQIAYPANNKLTLYSLYLHTAPIIEYHFEEHEIVGASYYGRYDTDNNHDGQLDPMGEDFIKLGDKVTVGKARTDLGDGRYQLLTANGIKMPSDATVHISNIKPQEFVTTIQGNSANMRKGNSDRAAVEKLLTAGSSITVNVYQSEEQKKNRRYRVLKAHDAQGAEVAISKKSTISASNLTVVPPETPLQSSPSNGVVTKQMEERAGTNLNPTQSVSDIKAGDILGKPGIYNYDWGETELDKMIHLEVFTFDDVAGFQQKAKEAYTKNPESMSEEEKAARPKENLLIIPPNDKRYTKEANTDPEAKAVFHELPETRKEYYKKVVQPLKKLDKIKDQEGKEYICIAKQGIEVYVEYKKEYETHGITLEAFTVIDKAGADKVGIFEDISKFYHPNPEEDETPEQDKEQLNETFKEILKSIRLDENADGRLEAGEFASLALNAERREQLSYFAVKHESEWDGDVSRYQDIITYLQSDPRLKPNELMFKDRVEKLALWPKQILGQSATPTFFHPIALISVFQGNTKSPCHLTIDRFIEMVYFLREKENLRTYKESFFDLTRTEMLNMLTSSKDEKLIDIKPKIQLFVDEMNAMFEKYQIDSCKRRIHFLSQMYLETMKFRASQEAIGVCNGYFGGCDFRGRGMKQLTHDFNYLAYYDYIHNTNYNTAYFQAKGRRYTSVKSMIGRHPKLTQDFYNNTLKPFTKKISTELFYAFDSAGWFSTINSPNAIVAMDNGLTDDDVKKVTQIINGGVNNLDDRQNYCRWLKDFFKDDL